VLWLLLIACAPTYASAGILSPCILLLARLLQGLSLGGEYGASATYLSEMADSKHRGFYSSFQYVTLIGGQLLALICCWSCRNSCSAPKNCAPGAGAFRFSSARRWQCWPCACATICRKPSL
jgi:MFS family permease